MLAGKYKHRIGAKQCTDTLYQTDQNSVCDYVRDMSLVAATAAGGGSIGEEKIRKGLISYFVIFDEL